jgi:hypothetical protein
VKALGVPEDHPGLKQLFVHDKNANIQRRDELFRAYREKEAPNGKSILCRFFMRGLCIFSPNDCKFAHGIKDLKWKPLDFEEHFKMSSKKFDEEYKSWSKRWAEILKEQQPSLNLEYTYKNLLEYQEEFFKQGLVDKKMTIEELDANEDNRRDLKVLMHVALTKEFIDHLFYHYQVPALNKVFVDRCFQSIGWMTNWGRVLDDEYCYEVKHPKFGASISKIPDLKDLEPFIHKCIIKIIQANKLLENLPISPSLISKYFYKDILAEDATLPTIHIFLKKKKSPL